MKKAPTPFNDEPAGMPEPANDASFEDFANDMDFQRKVNHPDYPHKGAGTHVPMWITPALAKQLMISHGHTGHVIPHPRMKTLRR